MLFAVLVVALVACIVGPNFLAVAVLLVFLPVTFVLRAVSVVVNAVAMGFIVLPVSIVDVTIGMDEATTAISLVVLPVTFVKRAINPDLDTLAVLLAIAVPFAGVLSAVVKDLLVLAGTGCVVVTRRLWVVFKGRQLGLNLLHELTGSLDVSLGS